MAIRVIVLAAGKGTRMKSELPKVLHELAGKPLLGHVLDSTAALSPASTTVVIGHGADQVRSRMQTHVAEQSGTHSSGTLQFAMQAEQLGTGHAVMQGLDGIEDNDTVLITYGDVPLTRVATYQQMIDAVADNAMGLLTVRLPNPTGYGRIIRANGVATGKILQVVEEKDATEEQRKEQEINAGVISIHGRWLRQLLSMISNDNAQNEYYLTDLIELAVAEGLSVQAVNPVDIWETDGVNSRLQLAMLERQYQLNRADELMAAGVTIRDPSRLDVRGTLTTGTDVIIDINAVFIGQCSIGSHVTIGPNCVITDSHIADGSTIHANSVLESTVVGENGNIGPFARTRPGTVLAANVRIGNFVETKNATLDVGSKINHLSYVGDSVVGERVNIGAGTITCNYDGANKHQTVIDSDAFIGSNTSLVAPVRVGEGATTGAGSTITRDVEPAKLAITRARQLVINGWQRPTKKNKKS